MKTIRWGIIGCGDVCEVKSGPGFYKAEHSALLAVMRRNGALAEDFARRHGVPRWHDDAEAIITAPDIDAVYVATPPSTHKEYALRCARAGKPCYVEKPMALTGADCAEMLATAHAHQVPLWVGYYRRALPRFLHVKTLLDDGAIGAVRTVTVTHRLPLMTPQGGALAWRLDPAVNGGGLFYDLGCHTLDILDFLLGPVAEAKGFAANLGGAYAAEDTVVAALRFASGVHGTGSWNFAAADEREDVEIAGAQGRITFSTFTPSPIRLRRGDRAEEFPVADPPHVHQPLIQTIVDEMNGKGRCPSPGESAARTARVMDAIVAEFRAAS